MDAGCYPIAATRALFGEDYSELWSSLHFEPDYSVDTRGSATLKYETGPTVFLEWGFGMTYSNEIRFRCEKGNIIVNRAFSKPEDLLTSIEIIDSIGNSSKIPIEPSNHFVQMLSNSCSQTSFDWIRGQSAMIREICKNHFPTLVPVEGERGDHKSPNTSEEI